MLPTRREPRGGGSDDSELRHERLSKGPGRVTAPYRPTGTEDGQGRRGRSEQNTRRRSGRPLPLQPELFELSFDEEPGGSRPHRLAGVRPQERVQRHTVEQIVDSAPGLPTLDAPVPLMVEQLVEVLQVIDVPKIILEDIPPRISVREPQLAEQLVEVPTILYFLKQTVDIPVPRGRGRRHHVTALAARIV